MLTNETLQVIAKRRSIRKYKPEPITNEELNAIVDAGLAAPYAMQGSWHFTVIRNSEMIAKLNNEAKSVAVQMGIPHLSQIAQNDAFHCLYNAPTAIIISGNENTPNPEWDCAAAAQNMLIAAESLGIGACWVYFTILAFMGANGAELKKTLQIPDGFKPSISIALGYKDEVIGMAERKTDVVTFID